jgi:hypothetical protein
VVTFSKLIKRDPKDFPTTSDIKDWDKYRHGTQATAKVQDVEPPFNPTYVPSATDKLAYQSPPTPSQVKLVVKSSNEKDDGKDAIAAKDTKEAPSTPSSPLAFPTALLSSNEDATGTLIIEGDVAEGNLESTENFSHLSLTRALSFMMVAADPPLSSFHRGHQAFSTVKLKMNPYWETGINANASTPLYVREMTVYSDPGKTFAPRDTGSHLSTAPQSTDTGAPATFSSSTSMTTQVPHISHSVLCDPSSHSVVNIFSQDHGESFTERLLRNDFAPDSIRLLRNDIFSQDHGESFTEHLL